MDKILLSNDDGYQAPGLAALERVCKARAEVVVVAPDRNRSGASNSLTLNRSVSVEQAENGFYYVDGTPTDCVHIAITGLMSSAPDMVVAGINTGANLGDDVLYSGTVAAAVEGRFLGFPALAVSLVGSSPNYYDTAAQVVDRVLTGLHRQPLPNDSILNINVPDVPFEQLNGFRVSRLGCRHKAQSATRDESSSTRLSYWIGPPGDAQDAGQGTDFHAIDCGYVSITPIQIDLTRHDQIPVIGDWLDFVEQM